MKGKDGYDIPEPRHDWAFEIMEDVHDEINQIKRQNEELSRIKK